MEVANTLASLCTVSASWQTQVRPRRPHTRDRPGSAMGGIMSVGTRSSLCAGRRSVGPQARDAGAIEAIFSSLAIRDQVAPPTINLENVDCDTQVDLCANGKRERKIDVALSNSFGFGGTNASLVLGRVR